MDFEKICNERFSVRGFSDRPIEDEKIKKMLETVRLAPTAMNGQPYEIFVVKSKDGLGKIRKASQCIFGADVVFIVCKDINKTWKQRISGEDETLQDIGIITATLMYSAWEQGLGSTYVCAFDPNILKQEFGLPENLVAESLLPIGYAANGILPSPRHSDRRKIEEFVHEL